MSGVPPEPRIRNEELLADVIAGLIGDARHVAVGNASPIPALAAMLCRARGSGRPYVSVLGSAWPRIVKEIRERLNRA